MDAGSRYEQLPDILTVDETAEFLRLGRSSVYDAIRMKEIPAVRIGRRILVPKVVLERLFVNPLTTVEPEKRS